MRSIKNVIGKGKKIYSIIAGLMFFWALGAVTIYAAEEKPNISDFKFPKPAAPNYMMFEAADRNEKEGNDMLTVVSVTDQSVLELASEYYMDAEAFYEKYGLYSFTMVMQYDSSLDGTDNWNHNEEWDTYYSAPGLDSATNICWLADAMFEQVTIFDLYYDQYEDLAPAIISKNQKDGDYTWTTRYFDEKNHSLYIRCRYYMEWETYDGEQIGEKKSKFGEWSEPAVFGKNGTAVTPTEPKGYEAPIISDLALVLPEKEGESGYLTYIQTTPEQVWQAGIYYTMTGNGAMDSLETEICVGDGDWQTCDTGNSYWALSNGQRWIYDNELIAGIKEDIIVKLRIRFSGTHGTSEWSNVLELNGEGKGQSIQVNGSTGQQTGESTDQTSSEKGNGQKSSGNSKNQPGAAAGTQLGTSIMLWSAILLAVLMVIILLVAVIMGRRKKK